VGHPVDPASELRGIVLGRRTGLKRCGVNLLRVPPGKESFVHEDLVHLSGGEGVDPGISDFPDLGKRLVHLGGEIVVYPLASGERLFGR
jgi:hypothetical protein